MQWPKMVQWDRIFKRTVLSQQILGSSELDESWFSLANDIRVSLLCG